MNNSLFYLLLQETVKDKEYTDYLKIHRTNVLKGYDWLKENLPELLSEDNYIEETVYYGELDDIIKKHDSSKYIRIPDAENYYELCCEYDAYADYFYGERIPEVEEHFDKAWLSHIHHNPHHWQHWILHNDSDGIKLIDMPYVFIIEMFCDHWSFSWKNNDLTEIFSWYEKNKSNMMMSDKTRVTYEEILKKVKSKL